MESVLGNLARMILGLPINFNASNGDMEASEEESQEDGQDQQEETKPSSSVQPTPEKLSPEAKQCLLKLPGMKSNLCWVYRSRLLNTTDEVHACILEYVKNGQEHNFGIKVKRILRIVREGDIDFHHKDETKNRFRMLLWHGTKLDKVAPILENGFQLPVSKKQMFGKGIYFADRISKSCNYGDGTGAGNTAYLLLCDVLLGKMYNAKKAHNEYTEAPRGFKKKFGSVMCTGENVPRRCDNEVVDGCIIPCGKTVKNTKFSSFAVQFNEYIVYDTSKIRIKYLVQVEFGTKKFS